MTTTGFQGFERLGNTFVRTGGIQGMRHIILAEGGEGLVEERISGSIGNGPFHQFPDTIAHKPPHIVDGMLR